MNNFRIKDFTRIKHLYFDEGWEQADIALEFKCASSSISRIINDVVSPLEIRRAKKKLQYLPNFKPNSDEPSHIKNLRCQRRRLPTTKLNVNLVKDIRKHYFIGTYNQVELAHKYKVNQSTICGILTGKTWKICKC